MLTESNSHLDLSSQILKLLSVQALDGVPKVLSELTGSEHCVIWKPSRQLAKQGGVNDAIDADLGRLYPYSSDFDSLVTAAVQHAGIPLEPEIDTTGRFYRSNDQSTIENDFPTRDRDSKGAEFMAGEGLQRVCLTRFPMLKEEGDFVIGIYRRGDQHEFETEDSQRLEALARFLPILYEKLFATKLRFVVQEVNSLLQPKVPSLEEARKPLERLCQFLSVQFHIKEVSIFLRSPFSDDPAFSCLASTVFESLHKKKYLPNKEEGLTGYVLDTQKTVWFHNLHNFFDSAGRELPHPIIQIHYPGIRCTDGARFISLAREQYKLSSNSPPPPLSFLAVPVKMVSENQEHVTSREVVAGVLRASLGGNPFHFLKEQIQVFEIIATEIGRWWGSLIHGIEQERRSNIWQALRDSMTAQQDYLDSHDDITGLCSSLVTSIIKPALVDMACFRRGKERDTLKLVALEISETEKQHLVNTAPGNLSRLKAGDTVPLVAEPPSPDDFTSWIINRGVQDLSGGEPTPEKALFSGMCRVLSFPIFIKTELYGVLDLGFRDDFSYLPAAERIHNYGTVLARQMALFEHIQETRERVKESQKKEIRTYAAVTHQMKTPLFTAGRRLRELIEKSPGDWSDRECRSLKKVYGMVRKARNVTNMIDTMGRIVAGDKIKARRIKRLHADEAKKLCLEVAQNAMSLVDARMQSKFILVPEDWGFRDAFLWDTDFAEQCLDAVINNAFKYSAPFRHVTIQGMAAEGGFCIRVTNFGPYVIMADEVSCCTQPYWRADKAREREGEGIGLWVADLLMRAQGGRIIIHPTKNQETVIELRFAKASLSTQHHK